MHPIHDVDVLLLMATMLASKRRPAELVEVVAAAALTHGFIPAEAKLAEAFQRLSGAGLLRRAEGGCTLSPAAEEIMAGQRKKADVAERIAHIREKLAAYDDTGEHALIQFTPDQIGAAIDAHQAAEKVAAKALLAPKPKLEAPDSKQAGQWRKFGATRRHRS